MRAERNDRGRPAANGTASNVITTDTHSVRPTSDPQRVDTVLDHFAMRLLTDCLAEATRAWWLKRAEDFVRARPQPGEFHGNATPEQLRQRWRRLTEIANACRARAQVAPLEEIDPDVRNVWGEAS